MKKLLTLLFLGTLSLISCSNNNEQENKSDKAYIVKYVSFHETAEYEHSAMIGTITTKEGKTFTYPYEYVKRLELHDNDTFVPPDEHFQIPTFVIMEVVFCEPIKVMGLNPGQQIYRVDTKPEEKYLQYFNTKEFYCAEFLTTGTELPAIPEFDANGQATGLIVVLGGNNKGAINHSLEQRSSGYAVDIAE